MRLVQVMVPAGKLEAVVGVLDEEEIDYALTDETSGRKYTAVVTFPIPVRAVEPVLAKLREAGIEQDAYTVVIDVETVVSQRYERLAERYAEETEAKDRIAREELLARAQDLAPDFPVFVVMTAISAIVATAGVLLDDPAVVVGSMVIAPLVGPAVSTSVGTVVNDRELFKRGVKLQVLGLLLAVFSAAAFAFLLRVGNAVPMSAEEVMEISQVQLRLAPDVMSLAVALGAGIAGALAVSSGVSAALVGVMIAAALVPPIAVVGVGIAWGDPGAILGSAVLVLVNVLSINFTALGTLWYQGYRPNRWFHRDAARRETIKRIGTLGLAILFLSAFLGVVTLGSYQTATYERSVGENVRVVVADYNGDNGRQLEVLEFNVRYDDRIPVRRPAKVVVTIGYPAENEPPSLAEQLAERINDAPSDTLGLGEPREVAVEVHYVGTEHAGPERSDADGTSPLNRSSALRPVASPTVG